MKQINVFTDGGARGNPGPAAAGVFIELAGKERLLCGKYLGVTTNNVAEYSAFLLAFEKLDSVPDILKSETEVNFFADSLLAVKQLSGEFRIKNSNLFELAKLVKSKEKEYLKVTYTHVPREKNKEADLQVNLVLDNQLKTP